MIDYGVKVPSHIDCVKNTLFVENLEVGVKKTSWGFEVPEERMDFLGEFIRPRWAKVLYKADNITDVDIGDWVLISYGLWSSSINIIKDGIEKSIWYISPKSMKKGALIAKSKTMPSVMKEYGFTE